MLAMATKRPIERHSMSHPDVLAQPSKVLWPSLVERAELARPNGTDVRGPATSSARINPAAFNALAQRCAPTTPATTLLAVSEVESALEPWTIRVNGSRPAILHPSSEAHAVRIATALIQASQNLDLGLTQINSRNLRRLGLSVEDAFDPCHNVAGGARILDEGYKRALIASSASDPLFQTTYSIYNTGTADRGLRNGYAAKVEAAGRLTRH
jgi:type IV secretion system protein VirB1